MFNSVHFLKVLAVNVFRLLLSKGCDVRIAVSQLQLIWPAYSCHQMEKKNYIHRNLAAKISSSEVVCIDFCLKNHTLEKIPVRIHIFTSSQSCPQSFNARRKWLEAPVTRPNLLLIIQQVSVAFTNGFEFNELVIYSSRLSEVIGRLESVWNDKTWPV